MADNRYYYFKDARGNRHTVDKTAYDKDPSGFAKAFPGARMEVIDRKTGRRGDVDVMDAGRVGDFGAHLFTGRTVSREKGKVKSEKSYSSALGRAQEKVAQEKWGGGVVTQGNTTAYESASAPMDAPTGKESELVKGLRAADAIRKRDEEQMPIDYTKPGAVKQMVGGARRAQKSLERRMGQAGQEAGRNAEGEIRRRNAPAFDLGNENVNNNIVKTRGQLEKEMEESAATIADKNFADTFANMIAGERQAAEKRGFDAYLQRTVFSATPMGSTLLGTIAYNAERDPAKLQQNLLNTLGKNMESMLSDPNVAQKVVTESKRLGVDPEDYVKTALMPSIQNKLMSEYDKTELKEWMPRNAFVDIIDGLGDGFQVGSILDAALTKAQRQYRQRAIMATQNGENPYYQRDKYGVTEGVRSALSLASDVVGPGGGVLGGIGKGVGAASAKVFGNEVKTIARMANMSKLQRMFKPSVLMRGAAETGANFGIYEGLKGAQNYASTTDDVKVGEMLKESVVSAAHGAVSGATLGVVGKMLGGLGYNVGIKGPSGVDPNFGKNMLKGLGMKGIQIIGEGTAFYAGGNFNNALSGADTDWSAGNLLSNIMAAGIYKIVSTHTATGAANMLTPKKGQSYGDSVAVKFGTALYKAAMAPSAQGKAFAFTPDEKQQLFASGDKAGLQGKEGYIEHPDILTWAERVSKATPVGKEDKSGNVQMVREYYESVMHDPNVSWDAKMKLNALLGIAPATRPEMDMRTYTVEDGKRYVNEYAKDGTLLSKRSYKNMEQLEAIEYDLMMQKENQRMLNGLGYILNRDCSRMDLQMEFLRQHDYDFDNPDSPRNQAIMDDMLGNNKTLTLKRGRTLHDEWLDFVSKNGITTKLIKDIADAHGLSVEEMFKIVNKEPIKRTEEEQKACVALRKALNNTVYEDGMPHADQADSDGKDVVEDNNLGTENPNNEAVAEVLNNMNNAEKAFNAALESNDVLKQEYERLTKEGLSEPQIYMELFNSGLTQEQLAPFADYINAKAKAVGMYRGTEQKIAETVQKHVEQWSCKGELNGEKQDGGQMLFVKDNNGRVLIVGAGDVAFDNEGRARESVGDMLSVLDPNTREMDFVSVKDVQLDHVEKTEDYAKNYQTMLEVKNSVVYAQNEQQKQKENAAGGVSPEGGKPNGEEGVKHSYTLGEKKAGNGEPFYQDESGNIDLATIPDEVFEGIGYTKAPFRLTPSMIKHMLDRHNKELGFKDEGEAINFVVDVMNNFDHVRLGYDGALVFSIENGRKRTGKRAVTVLINSDNGEFYGLKTSGYEGIKGLEKRPLLWERGANETSSTDAASASVTTSKGPISGGQSGSASHQGNGLHDKDSNNSPNGNGNKETLTFADGSPVPMKKDSKGRETADYSQMTPEQGAEWIKTRFGENADSFVDGRIKRAEKAVNDAEKIKVDMSGEEEDVAKALAARKAAIESAEKELTYFTMVKNVMKQAKAAEAAAGGEGATGNRYEQWRKDGYHIGEGGVRYDRQKKEDMTGVYGKDVKVDFTPTVGVNGRAKVVEVDSVQASHVNGQVNPMHFGPDWQPKDRTDDASKAGQDKALANFDPEKITGDGNAFIGSSPSVNERHEVIQGNNRAEILRRLYDEQPEKAAQYKQWLIDHAEEYGLDAAEIAKMKKPILVNELPVDDAKALELGQYRASDFESGGKELPRTSVVINRLGDKMQSVANIMLSQGSLPDDAKMSDLVSQNASKVLDYLVKEGVVSATEEQTLRKDATAMRQWMEELLKTGLFEGDKQTEAAFNQLPDNARRAVLATYLRDAKSGDEAKIKRNLQRSFEAYNEMMNNPAFVNAKNVADARAAVAAEIERGNNSLLGEEPIRERFSNFELELATLYKGLKDQKTLTGLLNKYFDSVQGDKATGKQLEIGQEPREAISKDEAIKEVFGLHESKPAETQNQVDKAVKNIATEITKKTGIEVVTDEKEAEKKSDQINEALKRGLQIDNSVKEFRTKDGEVYGFTDGEKIYLDTRKMKPETPLHEYAHLWCDMLRRVNPKEWENVKKLFDKVEGLKDEVQKLYPELEGDALYEEMITTYSGREGTKKLEDVVRKLAAEEGKSVTESTKAQGFLEKVKEALTKYWKGVADVLGIHFTTAEEVADKVLADWAKGVDPRESEKGRGKSEESESVVTPKGDKKGDIKDATAPKGEKTKEEPSKTNPLAWLAHTAEMFKDEQVQKAKEELAKAKESGDAEEIKRATADMKQAMETKLRGNGIGLVERRRIIGREIGKILGEEAGKAEAEKIYKPWEQMDLEEREAVSSKNPLTETEINELTSEENRELIPAALAYLRGDKGNIINAISYFKIWNDVRSRHENVPDNSGTKDGTQLDAPNTGGSQGLGLGRGRESGGPDGPVDRTDSERTAPGERESGTGGENNTPVSTGKPSNDKGEGNTPGMDAVPAGSPDTRGGGRLGNEGNVPKQGGQGGDNRPLDQNAGRKPTAKQGTHFPDSTSERLKQERAEYEQKKKDFWERWKKAGQGYMKIALTPFKALNLSPEQIEMLPELFKMHLNGAVLKIKEGIYKFNEWKAAMRAEEGEELKMIGLSDEDIDRFIEDYWNTPYQMDGETHTIGEWAGIHGNEELRNKLTEPLNEKYQRQVDAEPIKVKIGDKKNIEETLPYLLPQQQEDVLRAETQFFGNEHADREHAYGKGYMFTNGTGTGKTFTGLGIAKRLVKHGKGRILIVTPSQKKVSDWIKDGHNLNMEIRDLDSIAKERGTTATTENGEGVVITTFANFGVNKKLLEEKWDAVIYDESHRIMENKNGAETARSMQHYMVTNRSENHCFLRLQEINKDYQKVKSLGEQYDAEREKEMERIRKEYKASHPSATKRDVDYATSRMVPKERAFFAPGDYASFPKLGKIHAEFVKALSHYTNEVKPKLEAQAKAEWKDTKTIFLSATPFNTRENLDYVEGYIFKYPEVENGGRISGRSQFYLDHFGAAYKYRYNRLEQSTSNPEAVAKQEIAFSDYLQDTLGTMSGRIIDSPYDYSRDFPTVSPDHAEQFNQAVQDAVRGHGVLADAYRKTIGDYTYGSALFETMKVANIIERIKAHLDAGRKVVIFHRRVETKEPLKPPFALMLEQANHLVSIMGEGEDKKEAAQAVRDFRKKYADLLEWEQTLDYSMPREQIAKVFGKDNVLFFSGKESSKVKDKAVDTFNDDNSGKNIIVIQEASGKEGISLHDKTGEHQRVCITLALPQSPITALQIEGRTYRIGNKSNAIFEYPILGLNSEMMLFGQKFNNQVSTTENLALGSQARSLRDSFANGILEHSGVVPIDQQGVGGKEFDAPKEQDTDPFDNAVLDYYSNQKLNSRNREGVDYFPTPEPLGYKMMEWANMGEGDTVMEPSAGHGAIARYAPKGNQMVAIEPSQSLFAKLQLKAGGLGRKFVNTIFENYDISNKHDVVVMNPPFGTAGATAIAHLGKAFKHLEEGGRVVALIPRGSTDKKFDKWINGEKTAVMRAEVELPDIVFKQAGTNVVCRVVVVDKISNEAMRAKAGRVEKVSLGGHYDKIEDFFEDLRDIEMPDRIIDTNTIMQKKSKQTVKDLKELKDARVDFNEGGINVRVRGDWKDYSIPFDMEGYSAEQKKKFLASTYETFEQQERQTRNETSQAVLDELKKLTCKLADMTEEEMQRYLKKQSEGKGVMENIAHSAEVYNNAKKLRFQKAPKEEQSEELYLSLQNKKGKEYYDTVDILSERIADGRADIRGLSERPGRKEANRISAGIEIIAASRDKQNEAGTAKSNETKLRLGRVATEKAIEEWAKSNDAVFAEEDIAKGAMDGKPSAEGGEAVVYVSNDFSKVTKLVDPYPRNNGSIQLCMENTRLFNRLFPDAAYTVKGVARDKNGKFRIVMEQPYLEGKQYGEDTMAEYENGPSQAKDALMESLGLHDVYGDGLEFRNDKYYVSDLHPGNIVFDSEGQPHVIDADVKYYGVFRRDNIEGKPLIVDNEAKEPKTDTRNSEELFKSLKDKEGKEYYDTVTELAERMAGRTGRKEESVSEGQSQPRETSVGRNTERIVGRPKSVVHCAAEIIATDTERSYGNGGLQQSERGLERGEKNALVPREKSSQSEVSTAGVWENRVSDPVEREISKRIENWAKQTNHWFDWRSLRTKYDRTKQLGDGTEAESDVFLSKDGKTVLKVVRNPHALYTSLLGKLNSIALHNKLFDDVGQTIIGITRTTETDALGKDVSTIGLLIEQPFVEGKPVTDAFNNYGEEIAYIDKTMTDLGFKPEKWADNGGYFNGEPETVWRKDDVIVYDTHGNNIFIDKNGKPRLIDCGIETYKDYAKRHTKYDSTKAREAEYENAVRAVKSEIRALEKEVLNEERLIAMLRDNRREDNADKIDGFIKYHEEKIAELKHKIRINAQALQKPNSVHYRTESGDASLGLSKPLEGRIAETVEKVSKQTGGKVKMVNSVEEIENEQVRKDIESGKQVTGWYDEKTGEVHLYMPNIHDTYTAEKTVWHETVGHKGMRGLLGDKFNDYMRSLWMDLDNPINAELRAYVKEKMNMNHLGFYDAIEEFIAKSAEDGKGEPGFWNYIKNKVTDALHEIGYRVSPNVKDVKYMLWLAKNVQKHGDSPLWKMRAEAVRWKIEHEKTSSVVEENGMMYDNNGKKHGLLDLNKKDFDEATDGHVHYRTSPMTASKIEEYNRRLSTKWYAFKESTVDDMQSLQEAMQIISGVKDAYTDIPSAFNPLQCHNRMGSMVMQMCERYDREYTEPLGDAFKKVVSAMPGKDGAEQTRNANLYFIKKHGLERNRVLFVRDWFRKMETTEGADSEGLDNLDKAWKGERSDLRRALDSGQIDLREYYRQMDEWIVQNLDKDFKAEEHDYSGMHGIYDVKKGEEYDDSNVIDEVMSTESQLGADLVKIFWDAKKKATDFTIDQEYANGFMDKNGRDHLKEMFDWYVPLRKFDDTVAEDVYGYISGGDTKNDIGSVIEKASGRESLSDVNVLAQISALAKSSILNGGKNVERQHFMRFVEAYEKGDAKDRIFVEIQPWVEKHTVDGNEVWEEVMPNIPENSTQEQINDILNTFEDTMKAKQANGEAKIARRKSDIGYKFERSSDMNQHIVNVYVNGRVRRFVCQGNPRAAQAINGMLRDSGTRGWVSEKSAELNRICAQLNTSLNPDFISSNLMRDLTFASANLTKEGMGYTWDFCMEYAKNWASMARRKDGGFDGGYLGMFRRYKEGRLDANNQKERWFKEFMDNGGETGFVSLKKYEDIIKEYENLVKTGNKEGDRWLMKKLREGGALIELANEVVENVARYSTYCVSRKRGRSIGKSIYDAKEVSSNFNRHGSGDAIKSLKTEYDGKTDTAFRKSVGWFNSYMKNHIMFYNAGVQGANLFTKNLKHAPKTAAIAFGAMPFGLNIAVALLNQLLISQEDEKKRNGVKNPYAELPEWKRRNNLCIYWGGGKFKTIPMGIELRAFYGLGDIAAGYMVDESLKSDTPIGLDIIGQMAQLVPASDFLGHHSPSSGIKELGEDVILSMTPTTMKPYLELGFNRDWTGRPIYRDNDYLDKAPRWKRAYDSTNDAYMTINKWANKTFNGIDSTNEDLKGSGMLADAVDFITAPYGLQHIVEGYTGGAGATIGRTYQAGKSLVKGVVSGVKDDKGFAEGFNKEWDKVDPNTIPFYRVFNYTPKEGNDMQRTKSKWYNYADELEQLKYNMQQMKTNTPDTAKNIHNAAEKFKFSQSKDGRKLKIYEAADRYITAKRRILKRAKDKAVVEAVNEAINRKMQEAVEDLDKIE